MEIKFNGSEAEIPDIVDSDYYHYFYTLLKAIELVSYAKYVSNAGNHAISDVKGVEIKIGELLERTFAYELYRQWLNLLEDEGSELTVNAEVAKEMSLMPTVDAFHQIMNGTTKYPDLILHKSHNNLKYNTFVCEIKRHECKMERLEFGFKFADIVKKRFPELDALILQEINKWKSEHFGVNVPDEVLYQYGLTSPWFEEE